MRRECLHLIQVVTTLKSHDSAVLLLTTRRRCNTYKLSLTEKR